MLPTKSLALTRLQNELGLFASEDVAGIRVTKVFNHAITAALTEREHNFLRNHNKLYGHPYRVDPSIDLATAFVIDLRKDKEAST